MDSSSEGTSERPSVRSSRAWEWHVEDGSLGDRKYGCNFRREQYHCSRSYLHREGLPTGVIVCYNPAPCILLYNDSLSYMNFPCASFCMCGSDGSHVTLSMKLHHVARGKNLSTVPTGGMRTGRRVQNNGTMMLFLGCWIDVIVGRWWNIFMQKVTCDGLRNTCRLASYFKNKTLHSESQNGWGSEDVQTGWPQSCAVNPHLLVSWRQCCTLPERLVDRTVWSLLQPNGGKLKRHNGSWYLDRNEHPALLPTHLAY